jgi:hypothetical protein
VAQLTPYHAVLAFSKDLMYGSKGGVGLGDSLAEYFDQGGGVVVTPLLNLNGIYSDFFFLAILRYHKIFGCSL